MTRRDFLKWSVRGIAALTLADACLFEPNWIEFTKVPLVSRNDAATPVRFMQISDLHLKSLNHVLSGAIDKINQMNPDLLFLTGDSVDRQKDMSVLEEFMDGLALEIPKIAILGNWEYWGKIDLAQLAKIYERHNCRLLVNDSAAYKVQGRKVLVTGVDDLLGGNADIKTALHNYQDNDYHILLNHCPEYRDLMFRQVDVLSKIDAVLSGHTHGGQINVFGLVPVVVPGSGRYMRGWYASEDPPIYVSRGIGMSVAPVRFGARSEITTFEVNI